jgi:transmembrane 9 superfamily protein 2/4
MGHLRILFMMYFTDNMPVTWCYQGEPGQQFCTTGFPMGCYLPKNGKAKDACVMNVNSRIDIFNSLIHILIHIFNNLYEFFSLYLANRTHTTYSIMLISRLPTMVENPSLGVLNCRTT